jgi:hypothetical protein
VTPDARADLVCLSRREMKIPDLHELSAFGERSQQRCVGAELAREGWHETGAFDRRQERLPCTLLVRRKPHCKRSQAHRWSFGHDVVHGRRQRLEGVGR